MPAQIVPTPGWFAVLAPADPPWAFDGARPPTGSRPHDLRQHREHQQRDGLEMSARHQATGLKTPLGRLLAPGGRWGIIRASWPDPRCLDAHRAT